MNTLSNIDYPSSLPPPLHPIAYKPVSPQLQSRLQNGRTLTRRKFTAVPVDFECQWVMSDTEATNFEEFYQDTLKDGSKWFNMRLVLPQGRGMYKVRFVGIYEGPVRINSGGDMNGYWEYKAKMQMFVRP